MPPKRQSEEDKLKKKVQKQHNTIKELNLKLGHANNTIKILTAESSNYKSLVEEKTTQLVSQREEMELMKENMKDVLEQLTQCNSCSSEVECQKKDLQRNLQDNDHLIEMIDNLRCVVAKNTDEIGDLKLKYLQMNQLARDTFAFADGLVTRQTVMLETDKLHCIQNTQKANYLRGKLSRFLREDNISLETESHTTHDDASDEPHQKLQLHEAEDTMKQRSPGYQSSPSASQNIKEGAYGQHKQRTPCRLQPPPRS